MAARIGDGIQNEQVVLVDEGTLVVAQAAVVDAATAQSAADNVASDLATLDGRVAALEAHVLSYGGAYESNEAGSAITLTSNAAFYKWVTATSGTVKGAPWVTFDNGAGNKHLVVGASGAGLYLVNCHFSGTLGAANELKAAIFVGTLEQANLRVDQDVATLAKYQTGSITGLLTLAAGDIVSLRFGSDANTQTFTMKHANLTLVRIDI